MQQDPYASPHAPPPPPPGAGGGWTPSDWETADVLARAWEIFQLHWGPLCVGVFLYGLVHQLPRFATQMAKTAGTGAGSVGFTVFIGTSLVGTFIQAGVIQMSLKAVRGGTPDVADVFSGGPSFLPLLLTTWAYGLTVAAGLMVLVIPGAIFALGFVLAHLFAVDQKLGPVDAMNASWRATEGLKGKLLGLSAACIGLGLLGLLVCCVGAIPAVAVVHLAFAIVYVRVTATGSA